MGSPPAHPGQRPSDAARFDGRSALVTGAASGIGRATALRLAAEGARVLAADLDAAGAAATAARIRESGGRAEATACDVARASACRDAVAQAVSAFGALDLLCNVAGVFDAGRLEDLREETWERLVGVNLSGVLYMTQAALPHLRAGRGVVVNLASSAGLVGQAYTAAYAATKAGVVSLTRSLALELAADGVRVVCVCPGAVDTPMIRSYTPPVGAERRLVQRLAPLLLPIAAPEEIAAAVAWLASPEARYVTGAALAIDGGQTAG